MGNLWTLAVKHFFLTFRYCQLLSHPMVVHLAAYAGLLVLVVEGPSHLLADKTFHFESFNLSVFLFFAEVFLIRGNQIIHGFVNKESRNGNR